MNVYFQIYTCYVRKLFVIYPSGCWSSGNITNKFLTAGVTVYLTYTPLGHVQMFKKVYYRAAIRLAYRSYHTNIVACAFQLGGIMEKHIVNHDFLPHVIRVYILSVTPGPTSLNLNASAILRHTIYTQ